VPDTVQCNVHGELPKAYICVHLVGESSGRGFNREDPSEGDASPDAWCDDCEIIRAAHNAWDDVPNGLCEFALVCSECYERSRIRNTRPSVLFEELSGLRWQCSTCDEWHLGPCLDFGMPEPHYWDKSWSCGTRWSDPILGEAKQPSPTFLDEDYCSIDGKSFFVRGLIHLPILGAAESFRWGVWGSLSRENFERLLRLEESPEQVDLPPMFSWLSSRISEYADTLSLKMYAHIQEPGVRPHFRLERCDHPLSVEYHHGISPERVREIMFRNLPKHEA
jgi:hypothetical protein